MPSISKIEIFKVNIPFKYSFKHALKARHVSESIFVKVALKCGLSGYGESLPRSYVTGETQESVFKKLKEYAPSLIGADLKEADEGTRFIRDLDGIENEARCALEIALFDCLGKISDKPIRDLIGMTVNKTFRYSGIISGESLPKTAILALYFACHGYKDIKIKVGGDNDVSKVRLVRNIMSSADIRIDANSCWDVKRALDVIGKLRRFKISCIEQPVPKNDLEGMHQIADACPEPVIADESLCSKEDALKLASLKACDMFNVRLSKCGGILRSLDIIKIAEDYNFLYQIGCHVGESGILSAAARHLAAVVKNARYIEGSYSRILLKEDVVEEDLTPRHGEGPSLEKCGLGVTVREDIIRRYALTSHEVTI